jgi:hypothetical protein
MENLKNSQIIEEWTEKTSRNILSLVANDLPGWYKTSLRELLINSANDLLEKTFETKVPKMNVADFDSEGLPIFIQEITTK